MYKEPVIVCVPMKVFEPVLAKLPVFISNAFNLAMFEADIVSILFNLAMLEADIVSILFNLAIFEDVIVSILFNLAMFEADIVSILFNLAVVEDVNVFVVKLLAVNALRELKLSFVTIESPVRVFTIVPTLSTK